MAEPRTRVQAGGIGFIGLGKMGLPMAGRLVAAGNRVRAYDVSAAARQRAAAVGAEVVPDLAAALAEVVVLMLPDSTVVTSVIHDLRASAALRAGTIIIDMSSSAPESTRELASELAGLDLGLVDAPVSGGVAGAEAGDLTVMVGGSDDHVARVTPILATFGRVLRVGPTGAGHAVKALNNLLSATHLWVTSEAIVAGQRFGLDPETMLSVFNTSSGRSGSTEAKWPKFIVPHTYDSGFDLRLMVKDMRIAVRLGEFVGVPSRLGAEAVALWEEAARNLDATADHTEVARWIARDDGPADGGSPR